MESLSEDKGEVWPEVKHKLKDAGVHIFRLKEDLEKQVPNRAFLGVVTEPSEKGARIIEIIEGSTAQSAGLKEGDILCKVEDLKLTDHQDMAEALRSFKPGDEVHISYIREGKEESMHIALGENKSVIRRIERAFRDLPEFEDSHLREASCKPSQVKGAYLGVLMADDNDQVVITEVLANSPAQAVGLEAGDILLQIDDIKVKTPGDVATTIGQKESGKQVSLHIRRDGKKENIRVVLASRMACCPPVHCPPGCCMPGSPSDMMRLEKRIEQPELDNFNRSDAPSTLDIPSLQIFPNPTGDKVRVTFKSESTAPIKVRILDSQGRAVIVQSMIGTDSYDESFDLQSFPAGNYSLFIEQNGKFLTKTIIRNN